jgi:hypothetical protein
VLGRVGLWGDAVLLAQPPTSERRDGADSGVWARRRYWRGEHEHCGGSHPAGVQVGLAGMETLVTVTNRIQLVLFGMQNRTFGPYWASMRKILISVLAVSQRRSCM